MAVSKEGNMALNKGNARPLSSREIAKILTGLIGSLSSWCDVDEIFKALDHIHQYRDEYRSKFKAIKEVVADFQEDLKQL